MGIVRASGCRVTRYPVREPRRWPGVSHKVRGRLIRLGPAQLAVMGAGLLTVLFATYTAQWPLWEDVYARAYALPRMEERWGFRFGTIRGQRNGGEYYCIVSLTPDGRLARLGLRLHDMPGDYGTHGSPASLVLYRTLRASERGEATTFQVVNLDDYAAGRLAFRRIDVQPAR